LFRTVRKQRKNGYRCFSADEKINLSMTLIRISVEHPYRVDYEKLTVPLLYESAPYDTVVRALDPLAKFLENEGL
ncbi:MAG: hypothetical protein RSD80_04245, partial [Raoultibacter sp.]